MISFSMVSLRSRIRFLLVVALFVLSNEFIASSALQVQLPSSPRTTVQARAKWSALFSSRDNHETSSSSGTNRRGFLQSTCAALVPSLLGHVAPAHAGLMQFPCIRPLKNRYHFMRAGPSTLEDSGIYSTNPLFLTNRENALAETEEARRIVLAACNVIKASPNFPTVAYHSLAANGMDTADILATELRISRDRLLPEFTYLDQRGIGLWDSGAMDKVKPAIVALDYLEAGREGTGGRPPANEDGTPNETLADQFVRLRQFLSLQESRTSGENILIIFPDGTGPALLSAMIAGIPLNEAHCLDYAPGEVRLDISRDSVLELYRTKKDDPAYLATIENGKLQLEALRQQKGDIVSLKDQQQDMERQKIDTAFAEMKQAQREKERLEQQEKDQARREQASLERKAREDAKKEQLVAARALQEKNGEIKTSDKDVSVRVDGTTTFDEGNNGGILGAVGVGLLGVCAVAALGMSGGKQAPEFKTNPSSKLAMSELVAAETLAIGANGTVSVPLPPNMMADVVSELNSRKSTVPLMRGTMTTRQSKEKSIDAELAKLEAARQAMDGTLQNIKVTNGKANPDDGDVDLFQISSENDTANDELERLSAGQVAMNDYLDFDGGASDWLQVLAEIRDTPDEDADRINGEGLEGTTYEAVPFDFPK